MIRDAPALLARLRQVHAEIRDAVVSAFERTAHDRLAEATADEGGDTIFAIDRVSERVLLDHFAEIAAQWSCVLVCEGLGATGRVVLPAGTDAGGAELCIIVDPIDGTRGLMYQKRSAWILTGVAPNRGAATNLGDIELALQTEIPTLKQHLCDSLWLVDGRVAGERLDRLTGATTPIALRSSHASTIEHGFGGLARFFPAGSDILGAIDDGVVERVLGPARPGHAATFHDQYISTGGQLYELMMGHDRWIADIRPLLEPALRARGKTLGLACHPYDLCTESIARAAGVIVAAPTGAPLRAPLDVTTDVAWVGFANEAICEQVLPPLLELLHSHGLLAARDTPHGAS